MIAGVPTPTLRAHVTLFETPIGRCGLAWGPRGIVGVQLPEPAGAERARLLRRFPDAIEGVPPAPIGEAIVRIVAHLEGGSPDLDSIDLDMTGRAGIRPPRVRDRPRHSARCDAGPMARSPRSSATRAPLAPSGRLSVVTRSRSSSRVIACSRPRAGPEASRRTVASRPSCGCSRSKAPRVTRSSISSDHLRPQSAADAGARDGALLHRALHRAAVRSSCSATAFRCPWWAACCSPSQPRSPASSRTCSSASTRRRRTRCCSRSLPRSASARTCAR